jgi:uncharacterized protein (DUF4415 family)
MKTKMASYTLETLPPLTKAQRDNLAKLTTLPDDPIDTRDIPEPTDEQLKRAVRGRFYKPIKRQITARVDADVLEWLSRRGRATNPASTRSCGGKCSLRSRDDRRHTVSPARYHSDSSASASSHPSAPISVSTCSSTRPSPMEQYQATLSVSSGRTTFK